MTGSLRVLRNFLKTVSVKQHGRRYLSSTRVVLSERYQWSYCQGPADTPLQGLTVGKLMEQAAEKYGTKEAFISCHQNHRCTFEDLLEKSDKLAAGLLSLGLQPGDRVGIWAPNCMEWIITQYATARVGMILVNINPAYRAAEVELTMQKVGVKALIAAETFKTSNYYQMLEEIIPELSQSNHRTLNSAKLPELKHIIMITKRNLPITYNDCTTLLISQDKRRSFIELDDMTPTVYENGLLYYCKTIKRTRGVLRLDDIQQMESPYYRRKILDMQDIIQFDAPINIQFTSGATGIPKGVVLTQHSCVNYANYMGKTMGYDEEDAVILLQVPLIHIFGMLMGSMMSIAHGTKIVLPSASFDPVASVKAIQTEKCTSVYGTPTMFIDMMAVPNLDKYDFSSFKTGIISGTTVPAQVTKHVIDVFGCSDLRVAYGSTESSSAAFLTKKNAPFEKRVNTVGTLEAHIEAKIIDEEGRVVPIGEKGELCIRGYCNMRGYWEDPEKTAQAIGEDRFYRTGDLAIMDEEGYVKIVGSIKDLLNRGGEKIYPAEVERFLLKHPKIHDVQVIGVPDKRLGEQVCAWIQLKENEQATEDEMKEFCKDQIAHFKIPHYIQFVSSSPLTSLGRVQKKKIREMAVKQLGITCV